MKTKSLNESWSLLWKEERLQANVPCSLVSTLLAHHKIEDPYFSDNEQKTQWIFDEDYTFSKSFSVTEQDLNYAVVDLQFECLDTVCDIFLNDQLLSSEKNMFKQYRYAVKNNLHEGENELRILFHSPVQFLKDHPADLGKPFNVIRKAGCMFGWDWGITLPDSGILGNVSLILSDGAELTDLFVRQQHKANEVNLLVETLLTSGSADSVSLSLYDPEGTLLEERTLPAAELVSQQFTVSSPKLWMPAGYGDQPLYHVKAALLSNNEVVSEISRKIGLRTVQIDTSKEGKGHRFAFVINGTPVYFKGENLIINDAVIPNITDQTWEKLIHNALKSNLNGIRVWGGAYYPPEYFYELCDEAGLMVFQDFMFACTFYYPSKGFMENITGEIEYQIKRIRNHPSLVLWCGNNELDCIYTVMTAKDARTLALRKLFKADKPFDFKTALFIRYIYSKIFLKLIPQKVRSLSPDIPFIHSTPHTYRPLSAKSMVDYTWDGDMHYYLQYDNNAPYQIMQTKEMLCRFISEIGFQSYPSMKTLREYIAEEDLSPYSDVMYAHQKCFKGNETIELYMTRDYIVPKAFEDYVYLSQVQAGEIMRYTVEYQRRNNDYNRGVILWQLNDCWPVVSWSGIDYKGRWKAEQYFIRKFYAPLLVSCELKEGRAQLHATSDGKEKQEGTLNYRLYEEDCCVTDTTESFTLQGGNKCICTVDAPANQSSSCLAYSDGGAWNVQLFCPPKDFAFKTPKLTVDIQEKTDQYQISICSDVMCKDVMLDLAEHDAVFEDNYFDLIPGEPYSVAICKDETNLESLEQLQKELTVKTLNEVILRAR